MTTHLAVPGRARRNAARTAASTSRRVDLMSVSFSISARAPGAPPNREDSARVGHMRRVTAARLRYCGLDALRDDVTLIVSELLTNAILHSGTSTVGLVMAVRGGRVRLTVIDGMAGRPAMAGPVDEDTESGRGLALVDSVVQANGGAWGTQGAGRVWCELTVPAGEGQ